MTRKKTKTESGQTLFELLIARAIFGLILSPFISSVVNLSSVQLKNRHRIQATQYAREGLEIAYNIIVNTDVWEEVFTAAGDPSQNWKVQLAGGDYVSFTNGEEWLEGEKFKRVLYFGQADEETLEVVSKVAWQEKNKEQEVGLTTYLVDFGQFEK